MGSGSAALHQNLRNFFTSGMMEHWCRLLREAVDSPSLEIFHTLLDTHCTGLLNHGLNL